ncbi:hypothetical protein HDU89_000459 [Geranomyces variabilis]|nr:hypothetical protein HDU89_000459 [Geranomyces variabilis]
MVKWAWNVKDWDASRAELDVLLSYLPKKEQIRIRSFRFPVDGHRSLMGQILVRLAILTYMPDLQHMSDLVMGRTSAGKPILVSPENPGVAFNVSHHGDWVVVAANTAPLLGVDVSLVKPPSASSGETVDEFLEAFENFFTEKEWEYVHKGLAGEAQVDPTSQDRLHRFHQLWCLKESYVKAVGVGLGLDLERIEFSVTSDDKSPSSISSRTISMSLDGVVQTGLSFELSYLDSEHPVAVCYGLDAERAKPVVHSSSSSSSQVPPFDVLGWPAIKERIVALGDCRLAVC